MNKVHHMKEGPPMSEGSWLSVRTSSCGLTHAPHVWNKPPNNKSLNFSNGYTKVTCKNCLKKMSANKK